MGTHKILLCLSIWIYLYVYTLQLRRTSELLMDSLRQIGVCYRDAGMFERSEETLRQSLELKKQIVGANHPICCETLNNIGVLLQANEDFENANEYYSDCLRILEASPQNMRAYKTIIKYNIGTCFIGLKRYKEATKILKESLEMADNNFGSDHNLTKRVLLELERASKR